MVTKISELIINAVYYRYVHHSFVNYHKDMEILYYVNQSWSYYSDIHFSISMETG